ncbi:transcription activator-like protein [Wolffia australiana]
MERGEEEEKGKERREKEEGGRHISEMKAVTEGAYGGGMYGTEEGQLGKTGGPRASETQSADGPAEPLRAPKHKPPPSTGDVDVDVTGQSYFQ